MKYQDSEVSYVAGLFDALGNIRIKVPKGNIDSAFLFVWVTSNDFQLLEIFQRFGAVIDRKNEAQFRAKWKDGKAYSFLRTVIGRSRVKRDQMDVGIEFFENKLKNEDPQKYVLPLKVRLRLLKQDNPNT